MVHDDIQPVEMREATGHPFRVATDEAQTQPATETSGSMQLSGLAIDVWKSGKQEAKTWQFCNAQINTISIGRRSSADDGKSGEGAENLSFIPFASPVVSRKHAKIAFSDLGHAFLIDLHSHHGTYVLKASWTRLDPEVPYSLCDGDLIRFGKSVTTHLDCVQPIKARITLSYEPQSLSGARTPSMTRSLPPTPPSDIKNLPKSSGCYGIHSDEESSSSYSSSDVEGIQPPLIRHDEAQTFPPPDEHQPPEVPTLSRICNDVIGRMLPRASSDGQSRESPLSLFPAFPPSKPTTLQQSFQKFSEYISLSASAAFRLPSVGQAAQTDHAPHAIVDPSTGISPAYVSVQALDLEPSQGSQQPPFTEAAITSLAHVHGPEEDASALMNPASTGPESIDFCTAANTCASTRDPPCMAEPMVLDQSNSSKSATVELAFDATTTSCTAATITGNKIAALEQATCGNVVSYQDLQAVLASLMADVKEIGSELHRCDAYFRERIESIVERSTSLEERTAGLHETQSKLSDSMELLSVEELPGLRASLGDVQRQLGESSNARRGPIADNVLVEREDVRMAIEKVKFLYDDLKDLHNKAEAEIRAELEALKQAHANALSEAMQGLSTRPLRRKRSALDAEDEDDDTDWASDESAPPPKRARKIVSTVAQTTTAVTLGAVATWGILAFS